MGAGDEVFLFETITIDPPRDRIYRRLGYRRKTTVLSEAQRREIDDAIDRGSRLLRLKGVSRRLAVESRDPSGIVLAGGIRFDSARLSAFLEDCEEVLLLGATGGDAIMDAIADESAAQNLSRAVVLDATASETVDASLDWLVRYHATQLRREGKRILKRRYSAGYGDFDLRYQQEIYTLLELHRLGVAITGQAVLVPEKSVTAVTGILEERSAGKESARSG